MNEQYLFRGKRIDNDEWVYGWLRGLQRYNPQTKEISSVYFTEILDDFSSRANIVVDYKTIGQCTGTPDKNDKFVFGGDIVKAYKHNEMPYTEVVTFRDGCFWFGSWNWVEFLNVFRNIEVIGNIHDNPELLEVQNG